MKSAQQNIIAALESRGYKRRENPRSGGKYWEFTPPSDVSLSLVFGDHRMIVGKRGALRYTRTTIKASVPLLDSIKSKMLDEHNRLIQAKRRSICLSQTGDAS